MHTGADSQFSYEVVFTFEVDGGYYGGSYTAWKEPYVGEKIPVWYDPADPDRNDLVQKEMLMKWVYTVLFLVFGSWIIYSAIHSQTR
jgi:Protein of unknown function (DUF3592)